MDQRSPRRASVSSRRLSTSPTAVPTPPVWWIPSYSVSGICFVSVGYRLVFFDCLSKPHINIHNTHQHLLYVTLAPSLPRSQAQTTHRPLSTSPASRPSNTTNTPTDRIFAKATRYLRRRIASTGIPTRTNHRRPVTVAKLGPMSQHRCRQLLAPPTHLPTMTKTSPLAS